MGALVPCLVLAYAWGAVGTFIALYAVRGRGGDLPLALVLTALWPALACVAIGAGTVRALAWVLNTERER